MQPFATGRPNRGVSKIDNILSELRKELRLTLPISGYEVTLYEPLVASVQNLRNKFFAIVQSLTEKIELLQNTEPNNKQLRDELQQQILKEYRQKRIRFTIEALDKYVSENIDSPVPIDDLAASEVITYIPLLLELLAHSWVLRNIRVRCPAIIRKGKKEQVCGAEQTINIAFNPIYLSKLPDQITEEDERQFLKQIQETLKAQTTNISRLHIKVPSKTIKPKTLTVTLKEDATIVHQLEITIGYLRYGVAKEYGFKTLIDSPVALPFEHVLNVYKATYRKIDKQQNRVLAEMTLDKLPEIIELFSKLPQSEAELVRTQIQSALEDEPDITAYVDYHCPVCGNRSEIVFDPLAYFLATITMEEFLLT